MWRFFRILFFLQRIFQRQGQLTGLLLLLNGGVSFIVCDMGNPWVFLLQPGPIPMIYPYHKYRYGFLHLFSQVQVWVKIPTGDGMGWRERAQAFEEIKVAESCMIITVFY